MTMSFSSIFTSVILLILLGNSAAFAGTGQIFSPSGLPQSSTQNYTPPTPGNVPTVTFPTPPLPLGSEALQSFPGPSLPLNNSGTQKPSGTTTGSTSSQQPLPSTTQTNTVESFFQCNPANQTQQPKKKKSILKSPGKIIWHVLDNFGVPMFVGKDSDLDPSLSQAYVMPPPATSVKNTAPAIPQKIPESELEGTDVSPKNDQTLPLH